MVSVLTFDIFPALMGAKGRNDHLSPPQESVTFLDLPSHIDFTHYRTLSISAMCSSDGRVHILVHMGSVAIRLHVCGCRIQIRLNGSDLFPTLFSFADWLGYLTCQSSDLCHHDRLTTAGSSQWNERAIHPTSSRARVTVDNRKCFFVTEDEKLAGVTRTLKGMNCQSDVCDEESVIST
ncbi:unnamed protein product [Somion occarium]|uniref:Uncharacterized protein n=1 Tax=Somion occarium TaxID=3059160 RepID=A0ABP1EC93_9APHY